MITEMEKEMRQPMRAGLLSTAVIGWGLLREWWWVGILLAVALESPRFLSRRKDFQAADYLRAFNLSFLLMGVVAIILWIQDVERKQYEVLVEALPLFFLPVILCQRFSVDSHYPVHASTLMTHWRFKKDGQGAKVWRMNFGYFYLVMTMVAASWNLESLVLKGGFALLVALLLWRLVFGARKASGGIFQFAMYVMVLLLSVGSMYGLIRLYVYLESGKWYNLLKSSDTPAETTTALGKIGQIKLDPKIHWRIIEPETAPPALLRDRVFNRYVNRSWYHDPVSEQADREQDYDDLATNSFEGRVAFYVEQGMSEAEVKELTYQKLRIRGKAGVKTLLPITNSALMMDTLSVESIEFNSLGSYVATNPLSGVLDYVCYSQKERLKDLTEYPPNLEKDLFVPAPLKETLEEFLQEEGIEKGTTQKEASLFLKKVFQEDFTYSTNVTVTGVYPLKRFLLEGKSGHCEYYATAGAMLLRKLGIPARYAVGYAVREYDSKREQWLLRGIHAHAWVRAWDEQKQMWVDVDFTPSGDDVFAHKEPPVYQKAMDSILRWREDFIVWRADNSGTWVFTVLPWFLVLLLILVFGRNLLKASNQRNSRLDHVLSPLHRKPIQLPVREVSEPHEAWLARLPDDFPQKQNLITAVESSLYGQEETASLQEIKKLVKAMVKQRA